MFRAVFRHIVKLHKSRANFLCNNFTGFCLQKIPPVVYCAYKKQSVQRKELKQMLEALGGVMNTLMETLANLGIPMDEISAVIEPIIEQIMGLIGM